jgi:predicted kinase
MLALRYIQMRQPLFVFLMHGLSGSGKSVCSLAIVRCFNAIRLRSDLIRPVVQQRLQEQSQTSSSAAAATTATTSSVERYSEDVSKASYEQLASNTSWIVEQANMNVVVDATFLKRWQRELFISRSYRCSGAGAENVVQTKLLHLEVPLETLERRIRERKNDASEATVEVLHEQLRTQEPPDEAEARQLQMMTFTANDSPLTMVQRLQRECFPNSLISVSAVNSPQQQPSKESK